MRRLAVSVALLAVISVALEASAGAAGPDFRGGTYAGATSQQRGSIRFGITRKQAGPFAIWDRNRCTDGSRSFGLDGFLALYPIDRRGGFSGHGSFGHKFATLHLQGTVHGHRASGSFRIHVNDNGTGRTCDTGRVTFVANRVG